MRCMKFESVEFEIIVFNLYQIWFLNNFNRVARRVVRCGAVRVCMCFFYIYECLFCPAFDEIYKINFRLIWPKIQNATRLLLTFIHNITYLRLAALIFMKKWRFENWLRVLAVGPSWEISTAHQRDAGNNTDRFWSERMESNETGARERERDTHVSTRQANRQEIWQEKQQCTDCCNVQHQIIMCVEDIVSLVLLL